MSCIKNCKLCDRLTITQAITFNAAVNQLIVDIPANAYANREKYCIVFAQNIPTNATLNAQVVFTIGGDQTVGYPFLNKDCTPVYASQIRTRRVYPTRVSTTVGSGVFKYVGERCLPSNALTTRTTIPVNNVVTNDTVVSAKTTETSK